MENFKRLLKYIKPYKFLILLALFCAFVSNIAVIVATYLNGKAIDNIVGTNNVNFKGLSTILITLAVIYIVSSVFQWFISRYANKIAYIIVRDMRRDTFESLNNQPLAYYDHNPHGDIISRFTNDLDNVSDALAVSITNLFSGLVTVVASLIAMFYLNVGITIAILVVTPICFIVASTISKFNQRFFLKQQESVGELSSFVAEIVGNQKVVKAFNRESQSVEDFDKISDNLAETATRAMFASAMINPSTRFVNNIAYISVGLVGGILAVTKGVSVGIVSSFLIYANQFAKPFNEISGITAQIQTAFASLTRIFEIIDEEPESRDKDNAIELENCKGNIEIRNVDFSYDKKKPLIENFNFNAKAGETIAIVGPTGCGKTTLVNLLMRFYDIDKGEILIDGINVQDITRDSLRKTFGMVLQDPWLFKGTVKENIAYGKPWATDEEIIAAAKSAHAHSFIKRIKNGYDTIISDEDLSQGQRQLLTIARVMLADPKMLILDEATSSIDTLTEIRIQKAFLKLMEGRTSFVIAHRLSTIVSADKILVMNKGNIVEQGNHKELLEKKGFYYELYNSQYA
ncbi:ABC transporter transmembrane region [Clostridium bornimense]|uniref:ABC transporter transmembrane region n=1 Tax=Clostridium bornimense TaxID=1216932 RepID=W6S1R0_9CLOT|nr:ABC transporter ATP-binding protein [Clostridium bornimense]CDM69824.1 ABC transporter transmembrane region [Clostridium bornimense]